MSTQLSRCCVVVMPMFGQMILKQFGFAFLLQGPQLGIDVHSADMDKLFNTEALAVKTMIKAINNYSQKKSNCV